MYTSTLFRGASKIGKKSVFLPFGNSHKFGRWRKIKKKTCRNAYLGSIFMSGKYMLRCVLIVLLRR